MIIKYKCIIRFIQGNHICKFKFYRKKTPSLRKRLLKYLSGSVMNEERASTTMHLFHHILRTIF